MKKINFVFSLVAVALLSVVVQAASFSIVGGGDFSSVAGTTGQLQIQFNPAPQGITFADGGIRLSLTSSNPGVIRFTGAAILDAAARWGNSVQVIGVGADAVAQLNAFSVGNPGLPAAAVSTFATVDYEFLGDGTTTLALGVQGEDPLFDGVQEDVSGVISLGTSIINNVTGPIIPEPGTLAMAGMGLIGLVLRRRNG
jgi:hypothetical protein